MENATVIDNSASIDFSRMKKEDLHGVACAILKSASAAMQSPEIMRDFETWKLARNDAD